VVPAELEKVLIGLSTSGNSTKVVNAVKELCDICIMVPVKETFRVQEYHLPLYHALCAMIEVEFFD
jgi:D-sedoheptulose 7-phosphate isomerase